MLTAENRFWAVFDVSLYKTDTNCHPFILTWGKEKMDVLIVDLQDHPIDLRVATHLEGHILVEEKQPLLIT